MAINHNYTLEDCGVPMEQALSDAECGEIRVFFKTLLAKHDQARELGLKVKVSKFLAEYRIALHGEFRKPGSGVPRSIWTDENIDIAVKMRHEGKTWDAVSKVFGTSRQAAMNSVLRYAKERLH